LRPWAPLAFALLATSVLAGCRGSGSPEAGALPMHPWTPVPPVERAGPESVLVIYNRAAPDSDGNGRGDGQDVAEYYALRRNVPAENLLAVDLPAGDGTVDYAVFYDKVLTPVREKLHSAAADGRPFRERILYLLLAPGLPMAVNTHHDAETEHPVHGRSRNTADRRSLDQWLISVDDNFAAGVNRADGKPGAARELRLANARIDGRRLADLRIDGWRLARMKPGRTSLANLPLGGKKLGEVVVEKETRLGDVVVDGRRLAEVRLSRWIFWKRLGDIEAGTQEHPLALGDLPVRPMSLGASQPDILHPLTGAFVNDRPTSFRQLRAKDGKLAGTYLVTRLGRDLDSARRAVDGALYAERHLRAGGSGEPALSIWLDQKYGFAGDQVNSQAKCAGLVHPGGGLFAAGRSGPLGPWPLVIDNQAEEVGARPKEPAEAAPHKPTATARVRAVRGSLLLLEPAAVAGRRAPVADYFSPGWEIAVKGGAARATIRAVRARDNGLEVSSTDGFRAGDEVVSVWPGEFPAKDCFFFFGFYGLGRYEDVFAFPPGAMGIHVDSACMTWARGAMTRGAAATYGVVVEPFSAGVPYGHAVLTALVRGNDWAEATGGAVVLGQRWAGIAFGDPLYAPFRGAKLPDAAAPVLGEIAARPEKDGVRITVSLGGTSAEELADVALFRVEWGPDADCGRKLDFIEWPEPGNPSLAAKGRDYSGYARRGSRLITGLEKGQSYHFRVVARDPAGHETASPTDKFTW
jgi:hypothetical protein